VSKYLKKNLSLLYCIAHLTTNLRCPKDFQSKADESIPLFPCFIWTKLKSGDEEEWKSVRFSVLESVKFFKRGEFIRESGRQLGSEINNE